MASGEELLPPDSVTRLQIFLYGLAVRYPCGWIIVVVVVVFVVVVVVFVVVFVVVVILDVSLLLLLLIYIKYLTH